MDYTFVVTHLGGDDGKQVTLPQIKNYLEVMLRHGELIGVSPQLLEILQRAQDLTNADGRRAALRLLKYDLDHHNQRTISIPKAGFPNDDPRALAMATKEHDRVATALKASIDLLLPRKASS